MRRVFPDDRLTYALAGAQWLAGVPVPGLVGIPPGTVVSVFTDAAGTIPADVRHEDGSAVTFSSPLVVDTYSRVPLFQGPNDARDTLYVVVAGGPPDAVHARSDDRLDALETGTSGLALASDAAAIAAPVPGVSGFTRIVVQTAPDQPGIVAFGGHGDTIIKPLYEAKDGNGAPIWQITTAGGEWLNDQLKVARNVFADPTNFMDIYGYRVQNGVGEFSWAGPPGNLMSFADACQEIFEGSRAGTAGTWAVAFGSPGVAVGEFPVPSWSGNVVRVTAWTTSMTAVTATGNLGYPVTAAGTYSVVANVRAEVTARSAQVGVQWFDSGGNFISGTYGSTVATNASTYTKISSGSLTAPGGAAFAAVSVQWPTTVNGEQHRISGAALFPSVETEWSPPFVVQPLPNGGQAKAGDRWWRSSQAATTEQRIYICTTGGVPAAQVWVPWGTARLTNSTPAAVATSGAVGTGTDAARSDHVHAGVQLSSSTPGAVAATGAAGSATTGSKSDHVHAGVQLAATTPAAVATAGAVGSGTTAAKSDHVHAGAIVNVQTFTATGAGTWNKPAAGTIAIIDVIAAGGGGGAGRRGAAASIRAGGAGGGGGGVIASRIVPLSALGSTETIAVGAGGTAGTAAGANDTNGGAGGAGGSSSFGTWLVAGGGLGGGGGTATGATGGGGGAGDDFSPQGVDASATGLVGTNANSGYARPGAGASGGGLTTANATSSGGNGAGVGMRNYVGGGTGGTAGNNGGAATSVTAGVPLPGASGGGGGSSAAAVGGNGAAGGLYGAGGSGGGASTNGSASGAGGAGAQGVVQVVVI